MPIRRPAKIVARPRPNSGAALPSLARFRPKLARIGRILARFRRSMPGLDQSCGEFDRVMRVKICRTRELSCNLPQIWPTPGKFDRSHAKPNPFRAKFGQHRTAFGRFCLTFGRLRPDLVAHQANFCRNTGEIVQIRGQIWMSDAMTSPKPIGSRPHLAPSQLMPTPLLTIPLDDPSRRPIRRVFWAPQLSRHPGGTQVMTVRRHKPRHSLHRARTPCETAAARAPPLQHPPPPPAAQPLAAPVPRRPLRRATPGHGAVAKATPAAGGSSAAHTWRGTPRASA